MKLCKMWGQAASLAFVVLVPAASHAASLLRVACEGADVGAEVYVNGKFRGECPVDIQVSEGMLTLRVVKRLDADRERSFEQQARIGDGTIKKIDVTLSAPRLNPEAQRRFDERQRVEQAEAQRREQARQLALAEATQRDEAGAQGGDTTAMFSLAERYANGSGVVRNDEQALAWYRKAADAGSAMAMTALARRFESGTGVARDFAQAVALYTKAAEAGDAEAMYELGFIDQLGLGGKMNDAQAAVWFRRAATAGSSKAANWMGSQYLFGGRHAAKDPAQAMSWFRKSADAGNGAGMFWLHYMYQKGSGVPADAAAAEQWMQKAIGAYRTEVERDNADAMIGLAACIQATRRDEARALRERAITRYLQRANRGDARAMNAVAGFFYSVQNLAESARWHRAAADAGVVHSMVMLATLYFIGHGVPKSESESIAWRRKAAEHGDVVSADYLKALNK